MLCYSVAVTSAWLDSGKPKVVQRTLVLEDFESTHRLHTHNMSMSLKLC
jgi:hypothetical protein